MKAGRKQRAESYTVRVTVWVFRPDLTPTDAETCETRAFALFAASLAALDMDLLLHRRRADSCDCLDCQDT